MDFEKHRTLLFASNLEASQQMLGRCLVTDMDTVFGPAGTGVALPPGVGEDDEPSPAGVQITPTVGRFPHFGVWDGQPGMSRHRGDDLSLFGQDPHDGDVEGAEFRRSSRPSGKIITVRS